MFNSHRRAIPYTDEKVFRNFFTTSFNSTIVNTVWSICHILYLPRDMAHTTKRYESNFAVHSRATTWDHQRDSLPTCFLYLISWASYEKRLCNAKTPEQQKIKNENSLRLYLKILLLRPSQFNKKQDAHCGDKHLKRTHTERALFSIVITSKYAFVSNVNHRSPHVTSAWHE